MKESKKIAICFSGQPRNYTKTALGIKKNLIGSYDADIFIHHWNNIEPPRKRGEPHHFKDFTDHETLKNLYKPKAYKAQNQIQGLDDFHWRYNETNMQLKKQFNACSMFYSMLQSYEMMVQYAEEHNIVYDFMIKCRFDLFVEAELPWYEMDFNKPYIWSNNYVSDQIGIGNLEAMKPFMTTYNFLCQDIQKEKVRPETILERHIKLHGVDCEVIKYGGIPASKKHIYLKGERRTF